MISARIVVRTYILRMLFPGAGPHAGRFSAWITTTEAAPLVVGFDEWAPRTSIPCSLVTDKSQSSVIDVADADQPASLLPSRISPLHYHQLLSTQAAARRGTES